MRTPAIALPFAPMSATVHARVRVKTQMCAISIAAPMVAMWFILTTQNDFTSVPWSVGRHISPFKIKISKDFS